MPIYTRPSYKFICSGLDLAHPPDLLPTGRYRTLTNLRVNSKGAITSRPGHTKLNATPLSTIAITHSIKRLDNQALDETTLIVGSGTGVYFGETAYALVESGFSGNPLSLTSFRPSNDASPKMYIADSNKMRKISSGGAINEQGILPPRAEPLVNLGPNNFSVMDPYTSTSGWAAGGTAGAISIVDRTATSTTINYILYDSGTNGWACVNLSTMDASIQPGMTLLINNLEDTLVRDVIEAISSTTVAGVMYDTGSTGPCTIQLATSTSGLRPNALVQIGSTLVRVLSTTDTASETPSFRANVGVTLSAGNTVTGIKSLRANLNSTYSPGISARARSVQSTMAAGTGTIIKSITLNLAVSSGRPITPDDYLHFSVFVDLPTNVTGGKFQIDVDSTTNDFTRNYYTYAFTAGDLESLSQWKEFKIKVGKLVRSGTDQLATLANTKAFRLSMVVTDNTIIRLAGTWIGGTYAPSIPDGGSNYQYSYRYRSSLTGAKSSLSPISRMSVDAMREQIWITLTGSSDPQVDSIDLYRFGGGLDRWKYVSTFNNGTGIVVDAVSTIALNISEDAVFDDYKPFPVSYPTFTGIVNSVGTSVQWVSGQQFNLGLVAGNQINVNGVPAVIYSVISTTRIEVDMSVGVTTGVGYSIKDPIVMGTPMPCTWMFAGQGMGSYLMGVGDPYNPGYLHWCKPDDPDASSDQNFLELTSPSEPLLNGFMWNGQCFVWTPTRLFSITPAFNTPNQFVANEVQIGRGLVSSWAFCVGAKVWWVDEHGVWEWAGGAPTSLTDDSLYPLFPHDQEPTNIPVNAHYPIDYTLGFLPQLRLYNTTDSLFLVSRDTSPSGGKRVCYRFDFANPGWYRYLYSTEISCFYADEIKNRVVAGDDTGFIYKLGGVSDSGTAISCTIKTRDEDFGETRAGKIVGDVMLDLMPVGETVTAQLAFNNSSTLQTAVTFNYSSRAQSLLPFTPTTPHTPILNISLTISWSSTTVSPELYEWQPAVIVKPELSLLRAEDWTDAGFEGDKYMRGLILEADTVNQTLSIEVQYNTGLVGSTLSVIHNGQQVKPYPFTTPFIAHNVRLMPAVGTVNQWRNFRSAYIYDKYPELAQITTAWDSGGASGRKYVRGMLLTADTANTAINVKIQTEGEVDAVTIGCTHNGLSQIAYAFSTPFLAHNLRIVPLGNIRIFSVSFIFDQYPELIPLITEWSDLGVEARKYIRGMVMEGDTGNASVTVNIQADGSTTPVQNFVVQHNGNTTKPYAFTPFTAHLVRLSPTGNLGVFKIRWIFDEYPELIPLTTEWTDLGFAGDKYIRGMVVEGDTGNLATIINIQRDGGIVAATVTLTQDGRMEKPYAFTPFIAHEIRIVPTSGNLGIFKIRWIYDEYTELVNLITPWTNGGADGRKYVRGMLLTADSGSAPISIKIQSEGEVDAITVVCNHNGLSAIPYPFPSPFLAHNLRLSPQGNIRIFSVQYIFDSYPELSTIITEWSDCGFPGDKYMRGMVLEGDTGNVDATFDIQTDNNSGNSITTVTAKHNGRVEKPYAFTSPFLAHEIRLVPQTGNLGVFKVRWIYDEYAELSPIISSWTDCGHMGNKFIRGLIVEGDTNDVLVTLKIQKDGEVLAASPTLTTHGKQQITLAFTPFNAYLVRLVPDLAYRDFSASGHIQWIFDPYPEQALITGPWEIAEYDGAKFMQGILLTGIGTGSLTVQYDGGQTGAVISPSHSDLMTKAYSFPVPFIAHNLRLAPTTGNFGTARAHWIWEPAPELTEYWITQPTTHDMPGFHYHRDCYIALESYSAVTLTLTYHDSTTHSYTIPTTGGIYRRIRVPFNPKKSKATSYSLTAPAGSGFRLYKKDCEVWVKHWGSGDAYLSKNPFGGPSRADGAAI